MSLSVKEAFHADMQLHEWENRIAKGFVAPKSLSVLRNWSHRKVFLAYGFGLSLYWQHVNARINNERYRSRLGEAAECSGERIGLSFPEQFR